MDKQVLKMAVERYLLPSLLVPVRLQCFVTCHNNVRVHPWLRVACFAAWNDHSRLRDLMIINILKKTGSQTDVDSIRDIIGGKW